MAQAQDHGPRHHLQTRLAPSAARLAGRDPGLGEWPELGNGHVLPRHRGSHGVRGGKRMKEDVFLTLLGVCSCQDFYSLRQKVR